MYSIPGIADHVRSMAKVTCVSLMLATACGAAQDAPPPLPHVSIDAADFDATEDELREIATLIEQLTHIEKPDRGMAPWMSGSQFAPVPSSATFDTGIIMINHGLKTDDALTRLVVLGPKAIPSLLEALDDPTPSKLLMQHAGMMGAMWYGREVPINPGNMREVNAQRDHADVLRHGPDFSAGFDDHIEKHAITRGDICFVILGQIVGRSYQAARYQPSGCNVINSPTHDPAIANAVRAVWTSDDPASMLFESLLADFRTTGDAATFQIGAATRLLYYYPEAARELVVHRLDHFDVMKPAFKDGDWSDWERQMAFNGGARVDEFIKAVAFSDDPAVVDAILRVAARTDDPSTFAECLTAHTAARNPELVLRRMHEIVSVAPPVEQGPFGGEYHTLIAAAKFFPETSRPLFETYLDHDTLPCRRAAIHALKKPAKPIPWAVEFLAPLLEDTSDTGWQYGPDYDRQPIRVCDEAAQVLVDHLPDATFVYEGETANLDRQIRNIKLRLAGEPVPDMQTVDETAFDFEALPALQPIAAFELDQQIGSIFDFSDEKTIFCGVGYRAKGWAYDTLAIDVATGTPGQRVNINEWNGGVSMLRPMVTGIAHCYHGNDGGRIEIRSLRTGELLGEVDTPFSDMRGEDQNRWVRNLNDAGLTADGKWMISLTPDATLHAVNLESGAHEKLWQREGEAKFGQLHGSLTPIQGTNRFYIEFFAEDDPLRVWDHDSREMTEITKAPSGAWRAAWGKYAVNHLNGYIVLWDLDAKKPIDLPIPEGAAAADITCNADQTMWFLALADERILVYDGRGFAPIATLEVEKSEGRITLTPSADGRLLFWQSDLTRYDRKTGERSNQREKIAVFDVSKLADR